MMLVRVAELREADAGGAGDDVGELGDAALGELVELVAALAHHPLDDAQGRRLGHGQVERPAHGAVDADHRGDLVGRVDVLLEGDAASLDGLARLGAMTSAAART